MAILNPNFVPSVQERLGSGIAEIRTTTFGAKAYLLAGKFVYNGTWFEPKAKSIGAGVYILTAEQQ